MLIPYNIRNYKKISNYLSFFDGIFTNFIRNLGVFHRINTVFHIKHTSYPQVALGIAVLLTGGGRANSTRT